MPTVDIEFFDVWGKGAKQRVVRYGQMTGDLLIQWLNERPEVDTLLMLAPRGISAMLDRLQAHTGIKCNAHAFRRTFATESVRNGLNVFYVQSLLRRSPTSGSSRKVYSPAIAGRGLVYCSRQGVVSRLLVNSSFKRQVHSGTLYSN